MLSPVGQQDLLNCHRQSFETCRILSLKAEARPCPNDNFPFDNQIMQRDSAQLRGVLAH